MPTDRRDGPTLETYLETRFNLLLEANREKTETQKEALLAFIESTRLAAAAVKTAADAAQAATDLRYQQRFEAQSDALAAAFLSQQTAMQTAFVVAEKAVQAALAAADRAVSKAELAADKRFEALNELRQMLNDTLKNLMTRPEVVQLVGAAVEKIETVGRRIDTLESRFNTLAGEAQGNRRTKDDTKALWAIGIALLTMLLVVARMWAGH